jgi:hypothetical protein
MKGFVSQRTGTIVSDPDKSDVEKVSGEFLRAFQGACRGSGTAALKPFWRSSV